jgi:phosphoribosylaminoimidazole-succinocarboxamide synthase
MYPIECVVRAYLSGSGYKEYLASGAICGIELPAGLKSGDPLPEPLFTPAYKAELGEHDENISFEKVTQIVGKDIANKLRDASLEVFRRASALADKAGLILADTKFEFGKDPETGELVLGDEVLTPDSSRYWDKQATKQGVESQSFDKQIVRNWLLANWDPEGNTPPPTLPKEVVLETSARYAELREKLLAATQ